MDKPGQVYSIHYTCADFKTRQDDTTRPFISAISITNLDAKTTRDFDLASARSSVESARKKSKRGKRSTASKPVSLIEAEVEMLKSFYKYAKELGPVNWVHWNMRDNTYGFDVIAQRFSILGGSGHTECFHHSLRFNLNEGFKKLYGEDYVEYPRIENLLRLNPKIASHNVLSSTAELLALEEGNFRSLQCSASQKSRAILRFMELAVYDKLKTKATVRAKYGSSLGVIGAGFVLADASITARALRWVVYPGSVASLLKLVGIY